MSIYIDSGASFSQDGKYRYLLWREWRGYAIKENSRHFASSKRGEAYSQPKACLFIMLNPSTANATDDDSTIRRCVSFAKRLKFDRLEVVNLFAYRATNPKKLLAVPHHDDPVGFRNQEYVERASLDAGLIVCGWGNHGVHLQQDQTMLGWLRELKRHCLGFTQSGQPKHPLYLKSDAKLVEFDA